MEKILIADDDENLLRLYCLMLEKEYEVIGAKNGEGAVELYKEHRPGLTLIEPDMPEIQGEEAIKKIFDFGPEARIIAVTENRHAQEQLGVAVLKTQL